MSILKRISEAKVSIGAGGIQGFARNAEASCGCAECKRSLDRVRKGSVRLTLFHFKLLVR